MKTQAEEWHDHGNVCKTFSTNIKRKDGILNFLQFEALYRRAFLIGWQKTGNFTSQFSTKIDQKAAAGNIIATELYWNSQSAL